MIFEKIYRFIFARYNPRGGRPSFAGSGEDVIMADLLKKIGIEKPAYFDIGAYDPVFGNNTYYFYRIGCSGVLVEPNSEMCNKIRLKRHRDVCINAGVGGKRGEMDFFSFDRHTRDTFSIEEATAWKKKSGQQPTIEKKRVLSLNDLITETGVKPDIVSLDTEGYELEILDGFDWSIRPKIFCIETVSSSGQENLGIHVFMQRKGYRLAGKTQANGIYTDNE